LPHSKVLIASALKVRDHHIYQEVTNRNVDDYFPEPKYKELYMVMFNAYRASGEPPTPKVVREYLKHNVNKKTLTTHLEAILNKTKKTVDALEIPNYLDIQKRVVLKEGIQDRLLEITDELEEAKIDELEDYTLAIRSISAEAQSVLAGDESHELFLYSGVDATADFKFRYEENKKAGGTKLCNYGIKNLDEGFSGLRNSDTIFILGFAKQYKSTLLRNIAVNAQNQAKNVLYITIEMSVPELETSWLCMEMNNRDKYPDGARVTYKEILEAKVPLESEDFMFKVYDDICSSEDMGTLYLLHPKKNNYTYEDFEADYRRIKDKYMDIDLICIDSVNLMEDKEMTAVNEAITKMRQFTLREGVPILSPLQIKRSAFVQATQTEGNLYDLDAVRYFSEALTSATRVISTIQTEEMSEIGEVQIQPMLSRDTKLPKPFKMMLDAEVGVVRDLSSLEDVLVGDEGEVDEETLEEIMRVTSKQLFDD
jgi:replicative DNA helicase